MAVFSKSRRSNKLRWLWISAPQQRWLKHQNSNITLQMMAFQNSAYHAIFSLTTTASSAIGHSVTTIQVLRGQKLFWETHADSRLDLLLRDPTFITSKAEMGDGSWQASRISLVSGRQYPAVWWLGCVQSTDRPLVLVWNYSDHSDSISGLGGAVRKYWEKNKRDKHIQYNT